MSKIDPIGKWNAEAALYDAISLLKDFPDAEVIILSRKTQKHFIGMRSANLTNATCLWMLEEFKNDLFNDTHECKCEQLCE